MGCAGGCSTGALPGCQICGNKPLSRNRLQDFRPVDEVWLMGVFFIHLDVEGKRNVVLSCPPALMPVAPEVIFPGIGIGFQEVHDPVELVKGEMDVERLQDIDFTKTALHQSTGARLAFRWERFGHGSIYQA
jgi:hypothetical protein